MTSSTPENADTLHFRPNLMIVTLGVTQIIGYGTLYYAFAILAPEITGSMGWSQEWTYAGFGAGLLAGGLIAPWAGHLIDRHGARRTMAIGSALAALSLVCLSQSQEGWSYFASMIALEIASAFVLYDAAFTALTQANGEAARRAISKLTLIAGFASTIFWPLTSVLLVSFDWRSIYLIFAAVNILICVPAHALLLAGQKTGHVMATAANSTPVFSGPIVEAPRRRRAFLLLAVAFSLQGFVVSAMSVHMINMLQSLGLAAVAAVTLGSIVGPSQVTGRLIEMLFGRDIHPVTTAWVSAALMPIGFVMLWMGGSAFATAGLFAIAYGISMGLSSIVRGTVPLALFGRQGYGALLGKLSAPGLIIKAAGPFAFAIVIEHGGASTAIVLSAALSLIAAFAVFALRPYAFFRGDGN